MHNSTTSTQCCLQNLRILCFIENGIKVYVEADMRWGNLARKQSKVGHPDNKSGHLVLIRPDTREILAMVTISKLCRTQCLDLDLLKSLCINQCKINERLRLT